MAEPRKPRNIANEGRARSKRVAATKAGGGTPRSGQSFDLLDELNGMYESGRRVRESEIASARRSGYRAGGVDARKRPADPNPSPSPSPGSVASPPAPTRSATGSLNAPDARLQLPTWDRQTSARIIVVAVAIAGIGAVTRDVISGPAAPTSQITTVGGTTIKAPAHLHSLAGVLIVGTLALVVNEFSPQIGLALGVLLVFDVGVGIAGKGGLFDRLGKGVVAGGTPARTGSQNVPIPPQPKATKPSSSATSGTAPGAGAGKGGGGGGGGSF